MRTIALALGLVWAASAFQQSTSTYTYDVNGRRVPGVETRSGATSKSAVTRNINGREIPVEAMEERVVSDSGGVKVVERTIRRFDANGNPGPPERQRIETMKAADGTTKTATTVFRGDVNGRLQLAERTTSVERAGKVEVSVERPTLNASFELVERQEQSTRDLGGGRSTTTAVTRRVDSNGRLVDVARRDVERTESAAGTTENAVEYETAGTGQMRLARQVVTQTDPRGRKVVDTFEPSAPGTVVEANAKPLLNRRQVIEMTRTPTGAVETVSIAVPEGRGGGLGPLRKAEERVCTGECGEAKR